MKLAMATLVAVSALSFCAGPFALAADNSAIETKIKQMEDNWAASQLQKDHGASVVEGLLASDYAGVGSKGEMRTKASQIDQIKNDTDTYTGSTNDKMDVHVYGSDVATVCGTSSEKGKDKDGKEFSRSFAWVDTWMQRNGKWECIASSAIPVGATK